jgi:hypothetical protein
MAQLLLILHGFLLSQTVYQYRYHPLGNCISHKLTWIAYASCQAVGKAAMNHFIWINGLFGAKLLRLVSKSLFTFLLISIIILAKKE